jgi:hypothetical protein
MALAVTLGEEAKEAWWRCVFCFWSASAKEKGVGGISTCAVCARVA